MPINPNLLLAVNSDQTQGVNALFRGIEGARNRKINNAGKNLQQQKIGNDALKDRFASVYQGAIEVLPFLESGDVNGAMQSLTARKDILNRYRVDTQDTDQAIQMLSEDPTGGALKSNLEKIIAAGQQVFPSNQDSYGRVFEGINNEGKRILAQASNRGNIRELDISPVDKTEESLIREQGKADIKVNTESRLTDIKAEEKGKVVNAEGAAKRVQDTINIGLDAAKGIPVLKRSLALLDSVKTGGFQNAALRAKEAFGIESADEGELSSNMGAAILGDLKATFGPQFTEREGERLKNIRANFGKSTDTNKRLLKQSLQIAEDAANRAITEATNKRDFRAAQEIQDALDFKFEFDDTPNKNKPISVGRFTVEVIE